jgi:ATP-dependent RNA circularization protein (DNA/RNA ligase family)
MMNRKYDHLERWGHDEVSGIDIGDCLVFPKLDGSNARVWRSEIGVIEIGSRNRVIGMGDDHMGFRRWADENAAKLEDALSSFSSDVILYGEWLVPHTLRTYRPEAWRQFYVFDVWDVHGERYLSFDGYAEAIRGAGLHLVEPLARVRNPTTEQLHKLVEMNTVLIQDGAGAGEGIVVKNYNWRNQFGRQTWAKIVRAAFKEENRRAFGAPQLGEAFQVEAAIAEEFCTPELVAKERAKIEADGASGKTMIPRLLATVFYCVVNEEMWAAVKKHKCPTVDFKRLRRFIEDRTKRFAPDLFGIAEGDANA